MAATLDRAFSDELYADLPHAFRDLDTTGHLLAFVRVLGDIAGGLGLTLTVMEGDGYIRPLTLSNGSVVTIGDWVTVGSAVIDPGTGGAVLPLESPVTGLDPDNNLILVIVTGDWVLTDIDTLPEAWARWVAQVLSVDLTPVPAAYWRPWMTSEASRLTGSLAAIDEAVLWHVLDSIPYTVVATSQWEVTVTVEEEAIVTTEAELQAAIDAVAAAGVVVTLVLT